MSDRALLTVIILTKDEERHIERALASVADIADRCYVVDSGSTDRTIELAKAAGAIVLHNPWVNHATQFNWALDQLPSDTQWIMRLDADEIVTRPLAQEIQETLGAIADQVAGIVVSRRMCFLGRRIRWGGIFPIRLIRLFRIGKGKVENRWMDEHILVDGPTLDFRGEIIDDNRHSLTWWTAKHNHYATLEAVELLNLEFGFMQKDAAPRATQGKNAGAKRWIKETIYARVPGGVRALLYFLYRYIVRLGFLDGHEGAAFHVLQGFWYRYLVDMKLHEVRIYMTRNEVGPVAAIHAVLGIDVESSS
ncbi:MAG: glycosyltransferase family 2 protein [Pseudomonadota bacterium]